MIGRLAEAILGESPTEENSAHSHDQDDAETAQWQAIRARGHLSIGTLLEFEQAVSKIEQGYFIVTIKHHKITSLGDVCSRKPPQETKR